MNHSLLWRELNLRFCAWVFNGVNHSIEMMRFDDNLAWSDLGHGILGRILAFDKLALCLLGLRPVSFEDAIAQPFFLGPFKRKAQDCAFEFVSSSCNSGAMPNTSPQCSDNICPVEARYMASAVLARAPHPLSLSVEVLR